MRVLAVDHGGFMLDFVLRCMDDGHVVKWWVRDTPKTALIGKGLAERVDDWRKWALWADLIVLADNTKYVYGADQLRRAYPDIRIVGATESTADWELNRTLGQAVMKKAGIDVPSYREFRDYDQAIAYVKKEGRRFVSKPCGDEPDKSLSYVSKSPADMVYMLQRWKKAQKLKGSFMLQDFVAGCEMAVGNWFSPKAGFTQGWCENWEFKKLMAGETGPATGEMGTVVRYVARSKLADKVLKPLEEALAREGYCGYVDVNCIIDEKGDPHPLEFTMRPGWPTFNIQQALLKGDHAQWLADLCDGRDSKPWLLGKVALGVVMAIPDFPYSQMTRKEVIGVPVYGLKRSALGNIHPCELMMGEAPNDVNGKVVDLPTFLTAGDYVLVASGLGDSVSQAKRRAYQELEKIKAPSSPFWRPDIGDRLRKQLPQIQAQGYATNLAF